MRLPIAGTSHSAALRNQAGTKVVDRSERLAMRAARTPAHAGSRRAAAPAAPRARFEHSECSIPNRVQALVLGRCPAVVAIHSTNRAQSDMSARSMCLLRRLMSPKRQTAPAYMYLSRLFTSLQTRGEKFDSRCPHNVGWSLILNVLTLKCTELYSAFNADTTELEDL